MERDWNQSYLGMEARLNSKLDNYQNQVRNLQTSHLRLENKFDDSFEESK